MTVYERMLAQYKEKHQIATPNAAHEVMQQIALAGLYRGGFSTMRHFMAALVYVCSMICHDFRKTWISL